MATSYVSRSVALAALLATGTSLALAASPAVPGSGGVGQLKTTSVSTKHKLQGTYIDSATFAGTSLPAATFVPIGSVASLNCTNAAGCTLGAELMAQIAPVGAENPWAICINVDAALQYCPYVGSIPAATPVYVSGSMSYNFAVAYGAHTMQVVLYSAGASTLGAFEADYRLYKP